MVAGFIFTYCHLAPLTFRVRLVFLHRQDTGTKKSVIPGIRNRQVLYTEQDQIQSDIYLKSSSGNIYKIKYIEEETALINVTESS